jgi:FkbM family methyltransferase
MNIGDTPLFFAGLDCVEHIYGFEPFKKTFDQAQFNFNLNKDLGKKITAYNFGLSDKDKILDTVFCQDFTISNTTVLDQKLDKWTKSVMESSADIKEKVILKSATEEISKIISGTKNKVVIKMDCEGEEYAIFEALNKAKTFKNIDAIMLEYHRKGQKLILDILNENNFISFLRETDLLNGMIYAVRVS